MTAADQSVYSYRHALQLLTCTATTSLRFRSQRCHFSIATVRTLLEQLDAPETDKEIAKDLKVTIGQAREWIKRLVKEGVLEDIQLQCPGVSLDLIRKVLKDLRPRVKCLGRGKDAKWQKTTKW